MPNQMKALMHLAWKRCAGDIFDVIRIWIGGMLFLAMFIVFTMINFLTWFAPISEVPVSTYFTQIDALYISASWGFINIVSFGTFIAIIVCLLEYTYNFIIVCWYYDNKSWETPKVIKSVFVSIGTHLSNVRISNSKESDNNRNLLQSEINKIKFQQPSHIETVQPIFQNKKED